MAEKKPGRDGKNVGKRIGKRVEFDGGEGVYSQETRIGAGTRQVNFPFKFLLKRIDLSDGPWI